MSRKTPMTIEAHLEVASKLCQARELLRDVFGLIEPSYRKNSVQLNAAWALVRPGCHLDRLRCALDGDWHASISDAEYETHGNTYYRGC